jgi:hypothetical protein
MRLQSTRALTSALLLFWGLLTWSVFSLAHTRAETSAPAVQPALAGVVDTLVVENRLTGATTRYTVLHDSGVTTLLLRGDLASRLPDGASVEVQGTRNGGVLDVAQATIVNAAAPMPDAATTEVAGRFTIAHFDDFQHGVGAYRYAVIADDGVVTELALSFLPDEIEAGMRVSVAGRFANDGATLVPQRIAITGPSARESEPEVRAKSGNVNTVLVIQTNFNNTTAPPNFNTGATQVMVTNTKSVANYYNEVSYAQQTLSVTVTTNWITANYPAGCPSTTPTLMSFAAAANAAALSAGYNASNYNYVVYVFPYQGCPYAGIAFVGSPKYAFIDGPPNFETQIVAHEMGHNFGLGHAGALFCSGVPVCGLSDPGVGVDEYGDPYSTMGYQNPGHFDAAQKSLLGWFTATQIKTHGSATATYTLSPIETAGQALYAVKIPTSNPKRTYWVEFRQQIGFDNFPGYPYQDGGAQIRLAKPFEVVSGLDDTELLDMTPLTFDESDAAQTPSLPPFVDSSTGVTVEVISVVPGANGSVTVRVTTPGGTATTTTIATSLNPSTVGVSVTFTATITGTSLTGTVDFFDGGVPIGGCINKALSGSGGSRTATCTTSALILGTHTIEAAYSGDIANAPSNGSLQQTVNSTPGAERKFDFDGDGRSDVLWEYVTGTRVIWRMTGTTYSAAAIGSPGVTPYVAGIGDVSGEGRASIVYYDFGTNLVTIWRMNGFLKLGSYTLGPVGPGWYIEGIGDLNGDGYADILWRHTNGLVVAWLMHWNGTSFTYTVRTYGGVGSTWTMAGIGDLDGDGLADVLWLHQSGALYAWLTSPSGLKSISPVGVVGAGWDIVKVADFDGDGKADVFFRNGANNAIWYMSGASVSQVSLMPGVPVGWDIIAGGDYDGDGKYDLLWRYQTGPIYEWKMGARGAAPTSTGIGVVYPTWTVVGQ